MPNRYALRKFRIDAGSTVSEPRLIACGSLSVKPSTNSIPPRKVLTDIPTTGPPSCSARVHIGLWSSFFTNGGRYNRLLSEIRFATSMPSSSLAAPPYIPSPVNFLSADSKSSSSSSLNKLTMKPIEPIIGIPPAPAITPVDIIKLRRPILASLRSLEICCASASVTPISCIILATFVDPIESCPNLYIM